MITNLIDEQQLNDILLYGMKYLSPKFNPDYSIIHYQELQMEEGQKLGPHRLIPHMKNVFLIEYRFYRYPKLNISIKSKVARMTTVPLSNIIFKLGILDYTPNKYFSIRDYFFFRISLNLL